MPVKTTQFPLPISPPTRLIVVSPPFAPIDLATAMAETALSGASIAITFEGLDDNRAVHDNPSVVALCNATVMTLGAWDLFPLVVARMLNDAPWGPNGFGGMIAPHMIIGGYQFLLISLNAIKCHEGAGGLTARVHPTAMGIVNETIELAHHYVSDAPVKTSKRTWQSNKQRRQAQKRRDKKDAIKPSAMRDADALAGLVSAVRSLKSAMDDADEDGVPLTAADLDRALGSLRRDEW